MHCPAMFKEDRPDVMADLIRHYPLGMLITHSQEGLCANLIPFYLIERKGGTILQAHLARGNAQLHALRDGAEVLVTFQGPQSYITPNWYPSKAKHGEVVPTWNYAMVQARGTPSVFDDPAWLQQQITALTRQQEAPLPHPWQVSDAPAAYIEKNIKGIVGVEIAISRLEGKWKVSQNRSETDKQGVVDGLQHSGQHAMSELVASNGATCTAKA